MKRIIIMGIMILLVVAGYAGAVTIPPEVLSDYQPLEGYIVKQLGKDYLVDLDAEDGLHHGDILTVLASGEELVHPVTQQVIGTLEAVKVFLRVEKIHDGFSQVTPLDEAPELSPGEKVQRYALVPVAIDAGGEGAATLAGELREALPHLDWTGKVEPMISFKVLQGRLSALDPAGKLLCSYALEDEAIASDVAPQQQTAKTVSPIIHQQQQKQNGIWFGPNLKGAAIALVTGDVDGDGRQELAVLLNRQLEVGRIEQGSYQTIDSFEISGGKPIALEVIDLDGDNRDELYLVCENEDGVNSRVLAVVEKQVVVQGEVSWHLRKVTIPREGSVLLGQESSKVELFSGKIFRVSGEGGQLRKEAPLELPEQVNIYGFAPFLNEQGQLLYVYLSATDYLKVADVDGEVLWESDDYYGGSEVRVLRENEARDEEVMTFIRPRITVNREGEILVTWNDGIRLLSRYRAYNESQLVALSWNGFVMNEQWRTVVQKGYLADFSLADVDHDGKDELVTLVKFKRKGLLSGARSGVVFYELAGVASGE
ncbi:MAG: hypothetical protein C0624_01090 [Desulfuromonas sp.]|nr:MAG: hypothetical protein C0624_01090 [Desulfuromonas sp.]